MSKALQRLKKRATKKNRYDKFSKNFYIKAQRAFIKIAKKNKKKYYTFDNSEDDKNLEKRIFKLVRSKLIK
jgi:thymidylate kinase